MAAGPGSPSRIGTASRSGCPPGAQLGVRIHYKKTWQFEGKPLTDRSTVGVYFAKAAAAQELLLALPVGSLPQRRRRGSDR